MKIFYTEEKERKEKKMENKKKKYEKKNTAPTRTKKINFHSNRRTFLFCILHKININVLCNEEVDVDIY